MTDLDEQRLALIERIKQVFPKKPPEGKNGLKLLEDHAALYSYDNHLRETLEGKLWEEVIDVSEPSIIYTLSEVDYLRDITDEAYVYYLPAFLVATLKTPGAWVMYSMVNERIREVIYYFSLEQLDELIAFCEFHVRRSLEYAIGYADFVESLEDLQLRLMLRADELRAKGK